MQLTARVALFPLLPYRVVEIAIGMADPTDPSDSPKAAADVAGAAIPSDVVPHDEADDSDAGYDSATSTRASTSISSSVRDYAFENSRRYHKFQEGRYQFPNDEPEQEREDMKHAMVVHLCNGSLHYAPLEKPQRILDLGTGTGIWAIDMGDEYPEADVLGVDLSPIQPNWVPPNVRFVVDDIEADWIQPRESLDYVHIRHMASSIRDWPALLSRAYEALAPGAWLETQELRFELECDDGTLKETNQVAEFFGNVKKGLDVFGIDLLSMLRNRQRLVDAGFVNVEERVFKIPLGTWPKDERMKTIGLYNRSMVQDALQGVSIKPFIHGLGWTMEQIEVYLVGVRRDLADARQHAYIPFHVVTGQKPGVKGK
ncbi:S-adenosyl-L-methionine-dependent methyltransferase [Stachybotrys elegans]|uniref:S-adenosyl-L-methionine-dependent methyltransferase n=1 Tax=Stachybotrys elegans TaxID=80388 RepID=A0A8K0SQ49_9HYPO|nr:S-adenosyl-L-methionine-dependent methyltransferase [Stachybotrys elegans]